MQKQIYTAQEILSSNDSLLENLPKGYKKDFYYFLIKSSWPKLFFLLFTLYSFINVIFGFIYFNIPGSISGVDDPTYLDCFFFSVQTMTTIGYGTLYPSSTIANFVVSFEAIFGLISTALTTGLIFAKISKPNAKILFSKNLIVTKQNGRPCLAFRIGNARGNDIVSAKISVSALVDEYSNEGEHLRRIYDLKLNRDETPFFKLTWTLFHELNESSPLFNMDLENGNLRAIAVTVTGHDGTFSNTVYARHGYTTDNIQKNKFFVDIMTLLPNGGVEIDYSKFHDVKEIS